MTIDFGSLQRLTAAWSPVFLDAAVKGAVLLAAAGLLALAMRKASAASRQLIWLLALAALLVLPLTSLALPGWQVLPGWAKLEAPSPRPPAPLPKNSAGPQGGADLLATPVLPEAPPPEARSYVAPPGAEGPLIELSDAPAELTPAAAVQPAPPEAKGEPQPWRVTFLPWALLLWATGTAVCLLPPVLGRLSLRRLARASRRIDGGPWAELARRAAEAVGLRRRVVLLQSNAEPMPMVWGVLRAKLLIPAEAEDWPSERRWVVLLHELAHARRFDCLAKLIAHVACAVYWFNPLCWAAFKRMQREAEAACDDMVLTAGSRPSDYAGHLLEIASGLKSGMLAAYSSIAMARKSKLEGRLLAILDPRRNRRALTRLGIVLAGVLVAALAVPLSILQATTPEKPAATPAVSAARTTGLAAGEPKLTSPTRVFPTSPPAYKKATQHHFFAMRLSPDGKRVLYIRPVAGSEKADYRSAKFELVLRELDSGKQTVLPIEPLKSGWRTVPIRFNLFAPAGKRLLLPNITIETVRTGEGLSSSKFTVKWLVYDIAQSKPTSVDIERSMGLAKFTADGQALLVTIASNRRELATRIVSLKDPKAEARTLSAPGYVQSVCPAGGVAVFFAPPARPTTRPLDGERKQRPPSRLILWDLKADKELAQLPTHPRNGLLDDWETQWTPNGRYLYYRDVEEVAVDGGADRPRLRDVTRIWDRQTGKLLGTMEDAVPVGPGPGRSRMVLARRTRDGSGGFMLHDAATGKEYPVGDASKRLIHAYGGKVVYAETPAGSDTEVVFVADLAASDAAE